MRTRTGRSLAESTMGGASYHDPPTPARPRGRRCHRSPDPTPPQPSPRSREERGKESTNARPPTIEGFQVPTIPGYQRSEKVPVEANESTRPRASSSRPRVHRPTSRPHDPTSLPQGTFERAPADK